jgi:hypothetical protein
MKISQLLNKKFINIALNKKKIIYLLFLFFIFEIFLITHRVGFYFDNLINFNKKNQGLENVMVRGSILHQTVKIITENNIVDYNLERDSIIKEIDYPFENYFQRVVEISYPKLFNKNSKNLIAGNSTNILHCKAVTKKKNIVLYECK